MALVIPPKRQEVNKKKALLETNIWYKFNEGYTNAVRRTVKVHEFFWKFVDRRVEKEKWMKIISGIVALYTLAVRKSLNIIKSAGIWTRLHSAMTWMIKFFLNKTAPVMCFTLCGQKTMIQCEILCKRRSFVNLWKEIELSKWEKRYNKNFVSNSCKLNLKIIIENT